MLERRVAYASAIQIAPSAQNFAAEVLPDDGG